jgi:uncharacterized protein YnzC (UPF0291/DUF896 family)
MKIEYVALKLIMNKNFSYKNLKFRSDIMDELTKRVNFLYKKSKEEGLTEEEKIEQQQLRQKYIDNVKRNFRAQLDTIKKV